MYKASAESDSAIIASYLEGLRLADLRIRHGICSSTLDKILYVHGIARRRHLTTPDLCIQESVIAAYTAGKSIAEIKRLYGYGRTMINIMCRRAGIPIRDKRTYVPDDSFFDVIDTEEKAYWLGFILADGCIHAAKHTLNIALCLKDREHLNKFAMAIGLSPARVHLTSHTIGARRYMGCVISIPSRRLCASLARYNVTPRKSLSALPPPTDTLPTDLVRHFWRGLVDGDGSLFLTKRPVVSLCGTRPVIAAFLSWCKTIVETKARPCIQGRIFTCALANRMAVRVLARLYTGCAIALDRKRLIAEQILGLYGGIA